jgi:hypothetical protein
LNGQYLCHQKNKNKLHTSQNYYKEENIMVLMTLSTLAIVLALLVIYRFGHRYGNIKVLEWEKDTIYSNNDDDM